MDDMISRRAMTNELAIRILTGDVLGTTEQTHEAIKMAVKALSLPYAQPDDWMERNKDRILQAGMEGREIEFRIGGRLFAIREKAQ